MGQSQSSDLSEKNTRESDRRAVSDSVDDFDQHVDAQDVPRVQPAPALTEEPPNVAADIEDGNLSELRTSAATVPKKVPPAADEIQASTTREADAAIVSTSARTRSVKEAQGGAFSRSSTGRKGRKSLSSSHQFQVWSAFVNRHQKLLEARIKAEERRSAFREGRDNLREITNDFMGVVSEVQADPSDKQLKRLLSKSWKLKTAHEQLNAAEEALQFAESKLVQEEYAVRQAVPEVLRSDKDPEETLSFLEGRGFDFQGDTYLPESTAPTSDRDASVDWAMETQLINSKLDAVNVLERDILHLQAQRGQLVTEALIAPDQPSLGTGSTYAEDMDRCDQQERQLKAQLRTALDNIEDLRDNGPDFANEEYKASSLVATAPLEELTSSDRQPHLAQDSFDPKEGILKSENALTPLTEELSRLLLSITAEQIPIFPDEAIGMYNGLADPYDVVNSWLFYQLRSSEHEMKKYIRSLEQKGGSLQGLSTQAVLDLVLRAWYNDATYKITWTSQQHLNTTNNRSMKTNRDGSQGPYSTSTTAAHPSLRELFTSSNRNKWVANQSSRSIASDNQDARRIGAD